MKAVLCSKKAVLAAATVLPITAEVAEAEKAGPAKFGPGTANVLTQVSAKAPEAANSEAATAKPVAAPMPRRRELLTPTGSLAEDARIVCVPVRVPTNIRPPLYCTIQGRVFAPVSPQYKSLSKDGKAREVRKSVNSALFRVVCRFRNKGGKIRSR